MNKRFEGKHILVTGGNSGIGLSTARHIYTIQDGRIKTNWHLEDNLALMKQLGVIAP